MKVIPRSGSKFYEWATVTYPYATRSDNTKRWGLPDKIVSAEMDAAFEAYTTCYLIAENPTTRTSIIIRAKRVARQHFEKLFRAYIRAWIASNPHVSDAERRKMNLTVRDTTRTIVGPPVEMPLPEIDFSRRQQHGVIAKNAEGKRKKPLHVRGFEIYRKVGGDAPLNDDDFRYAGFATRSPFIIRYKLGDTSKIVWYRIRWVNAKNNPGPWSEIITAVIT
jgi:hypothetical protein